MADRIINQLEDHKRYGYGPDIPIVVGRPVVQAVVTGDEVAAWYWAHEKMRWDPNVDFGVIRPPFESMWVEWAMPPAHLRVGFTSTVDIEAAAVFVNYNKDDDAFDYLTIHRVRGLGIVVLPIFNRVRLTGAGTYESGGVEFDERASDHRFFQEVREAIADGRDLGYERFGSHELLLILSMMNCVNASIEDERASKGDVRRARQHGLPLHQIKKIRVPGGRATTKRSMVQALGGPQALHLVRGHFKTYTAEAPLFGKRVGSYWWGWQQRGKAEAGTIDHVYEVTP